MQDSQDDARRILPLEACNPQDSKSIQEAMDCATQEPNLSSHSPMDRGQHNPCYPLPLKNPSMRKHRDSHIETLPEGNCIDLLAAHDASNQPASEHTLKLMLLSLQKDLLNKLHSSISNLQSRIDHMEERTEHLERLKTENLAAYDESADAHDHQAKEILSG